jgi:voltage-dependent anion channel protein 2
MAFDTGKSKLTKNNFALGYSAGDLVIHTNVNDGQVLQLSMIQQKVHLGITSDSIG